MYLCKTSSLNSETTYQLTLDRPVFTGTQMGLGTKGQGQVIKDMVKENYKQHQGKYTRVTSLED